MASDIATCMFYTGIDPFTGDEVFTARNLSDRKMQRALRQFFKPENDFEVRKALLEAGRGYLIGSGCEALIPAQPPRPRGKPAWPGPKPWCRLPPESIDGPPTTPVPGPRRRDEQLPALSIQG